MKNITGDESAMPIMATEQSVTNQDPANPQPGLTIRQHFASMAMQGLLVQNMAVDRALNENNNLLLRQLAEASVKAADIIIEQLNKLPSNPS